MSLLARLWPYLAVVAALGGIVWWIDHSAAERTRNQIEAANSELEIKLRTDLRQTEQRLAGSIIDIDGKVRGQIGSIEQLHTTVIQPTLVKELSRETRFHDPAAGITDGVRAQINAALATVTCSPRPDGGIICALPDPQPARQQ